MGMGIYTPAEAAFYARVHTQVINRWLYGDKRGDRVLDAQVTLPDDKVVTFLDFVQALAIREIRTRHKIDLKRIRDAVRVAEEMGIRYPFARKHTAYLFGDHSGAGHGDIVLKIGDKMIQASGKAKKNLVLNTIAQLYLEDLAFSESGLAEQYTAWRGSGKREVIMNPHIRFGEPFIAGCDFTAQTLWEAYEIEGGIQEAAKAYDIDPEYVVLALRYQDHLLARAA